MKESEILKTTLQFARTGEIPDELIQFFDQNGHWIGDRRSWRHTIHAIAQLRMRSARLPASRRTRRSLAGLHLRTSFIWHRHTRAMITYCEVAGSIIIPKKVCIAAPNLRTVGRHFHTKTDLAINLPNLRYVGGDFDVICTWKLLAPRLKHVGGIAQVYGFSLPALETVGGRLWMYWTLVAIAPRLRTVGGSLYAHTASVFEAPKLQSVGHHLVVSDLTKRVSVPMLESIGGDFLAEGAEIIRAYRLKRVGSAIDTRKAKDFYLPNLNFGEAWLVHPDAVIRWKVRQAARRLLTNQPSIEI